MVTLSIDGQEISVAEGTPLVEAAAKAGIQIPTLCYLPGHEHISACMVCLVKDVGSGKIVPSCTAVAAEGMQIDTNSEEVVELRKASIDLLLSEHLGDCEAMCRLTCPHGMDIPLMLRQIQRDELGDALATVRETIAMPGVLGYVCEAPCEKACRRGRRDQPLAIKEEHRFLAEQEGKYRREQAACTGKRVAIVGAGIAGLSAAYYLAGTGHSCRLFEKQSAAGGYLRYGYDSETLPEQILESEIAHITNMLDVELSLDSVVYPSRLDELLVSHDAIILACGDIEEAGLLGTFDVSSTGVVVNPDYSTSRAGLFAIGGAFRRNGRIVQASADGLHVSRSVHSYLTAVDAAVTPPRFNSRLGALKEGELDEFMKCAEPSERQQMVSGGAINVETARSEAARCLHCDCRKQHSCKLRLYSDELQADQRCYERGERSSVEIADDHDEVVFEPGKCIKCGICIHVAADAGEAFGMTYTDRGYDLAVSVPFDEALREGLSKETALMCVEKCPVGAISFKHREDG